MKKIIFYIGVLAVVCSTWAGCKRDSDYIPVKPSPYISNFDLRKLFKDADLQLNTELLGGANAIKGIVISDFRSGNSPAGLLILQNSRTVGSGIDSLRGIAINVGSDASKYIPGDSVHVRIDGGVLKRVNGILQVEGISGASVSKMAANKLVKTQIVSVGGILASPGTYESTLVTIGSALVEPEPVTGETFSGDKTINDGSGKATVHTETTASFASASLLISGNFTGIPFVNDKKMQLWMRSIDDFRFAVLPKLSPAIISGYLADPNINPDGNYEYIQFLATKDIDFSKTPFSVYTTNNAGATNPFPTTGWNLGGVRTYKFKLTSGTVSKGQYFYIGGSTKLINGPSSTNISSSKWIASVNYTTATGADGIGAVTTNLLANSGNIAGIAIFEGTTVDVNTVPLDVIFYGGTGGNFYTAGPPEAGYRITNTDYYSTNNPSTGAKQGFMGAGTNTFRLGFPTAISFASFGGVYDATSGRWLTKRALTSIPLTATSQISVIEGGTALVN
ncbi:DUF5689 domain-containing protein [Pedobacter punctiformis]|uniref:DUF5689 domain-containing protein n=1 Tax=Pedobacter punctiformis TaxID=3004097 RepID=A0ABT4L7K3_9SPHI|nr:DUF5689 domain-containing protein [Pedobacter sp. HCMS5-2]MCZ4243806.1 DUF5689 domain-containing protein [Pedobacter sp. HCMS5-2]